MEEKYENYIIYGIIIVAIGILIYSLSWFIFTPETKTANSLQVTGGVVAKTESQDEMMTRMHPNQQGNPATSSAPVSAPAAAESQAEMIARMHPNQQ